MEMWVVLNVFISQNRKNGVKKKYGEIRGCDYFEWHDQPFEPQAIKVIKELQEKKLEAKV